MAGDLIITFGILGLFFAAVIGLLYKTYRQDRTFTGYAVGGRSFSAFYIAMSYTNSWWPGTTFIAYFGLTAAAGLLGWYALLYSLLGVTAMYLMAKRAWRWGSRYGLHTQPDMLGLRFDSKHVKVMASIIGVVSLFPWIVLAMQAMGAIFRWASLNELGIWTALFLGMGTIFIRQYWTVRMGMRGLVITDMLQGIVAYFGAGLICIGLLLFFFDGFSEIGSLDPAMYQLPGHGSELGGWYFAAITFTGIIGALCWPTSYQRIYTAKNVRHVKWGTFLTLPTAGIFYILLTLVAMAAASVPAVAADPQNGWFILTQEAGGTVLLGLGVLVVFAASMGWIDGCIQVCGTQVANDIVGQFRDLDDRARIFVAKVSMVVITTLGMAVAAAAFNYDNLINLAIMSYQGVVQLAVPMFLGIFWKGGNKHGALAGMIAGFGIALVLTWFYPDAISWAGGLTSGIIALGVNLAVYLACAWLIPRTDEDKRRVDELFASAEEREREEALGHAVLGAEPAKA
jgi:Na+/proline symporter